MRPYRDIAILAGAQIVCFLLLTHLEPTLFLIHLYQSILYTAILVLLFYMEDRWAYMIGMLVSVVWLAMAYTSGMLGRAIEQLFAPRTSSLAANLAGLLALVTALLAVLMIGFCGRHWKKEYSGLGKTRSTFLVSLGIVLAYYGILSQVVLGPDSKRMSVGKRRRRTFRPCYIPRRRFFHP
jgi:hypothetical protein